METCRGFEPFVQVLTEWRSVIDRLRFFPEGVLLTGKEKILHVSLVNTVCENRGCKTLRLLDQGGLNVPTRSTEPSDSDALGVNESVCRKFVDSGIDSGDSVLGPPRSPRVLGFIHYAYLEHHEAGTRKRPRRHCGGKTSVGHEHPVPEAMRLDHQRISLACAIAYGQPQSSGPAGSGTICPVVERCFAEQYI